ncbi:hypothetical protein OC861_003692 [Tilletia horrida]|nr:hypothetical protein OC861_003692 [Tilletia horrida]
MQRANELRTADPPMAYWCSLYAAQLGIGAKSTERDSKVFLGQLMDDLEAQKKALGTQDVITDETVAYAYVENFALKVFITADNQDRAGKATKATARNYLVASQFMEVLNVFGPLEAETAEKQKYAKWRAAEVSKAIKEGRVPEPVGSPTVDLPLLPDPLDNDPAAASVPSIPSTPGVLPGPPSNAPGTVLPSAPPLPPVSPTTFTASLQPPPPSQSPALPHSRGPLPQPPSRPTSMILGPHQPSASPTSSSPHPPPAGLPNSGPAPPPLPPSSPSPFPYHYQTSQSSILPQPPANGPLPQPPSHIQTQNSAALHSPSLFSGTGTSSHTSLPPSAPVPAAAPPPPHSVSGALPDSLTPSQTSKAQKLAKWAVSSLDYDDLATAAKHLREALDIVEGRAK